MFSGGREKVHWKQMTEFASDLPQIIIAIIYESIFRNKAIFVKPGYQKRSLRYISQSILLIHMNITFQV